MSRIARLAAFAATLCCLAWPVQAELIRSTASLSGSAESPPNTSPATGFGTVDYDSTSHFLTIFMSWTGLTAPTTVAHIHCCTALPEEGVAGVAVTTPSLPGFPTGVTSGTYQVLLDLTEALSFNPAFVTGAGGTLADAETALVAGLDEGRAYLNIHTTAFPAGEIRGFLQVSEPAALPLILLALIIASRHRHPACNANLSGCRPTLPRGRRLQGA